MGSKPSSSKIDAEKYSLSDFYGLLGNSLFEAGPLRVMTFGTRVKLCPRNSIITFDHQNNEACRVLFDVNFSRQGQKPSLSEGDLSYFEVRHFGPASTVGWMTQKKFVKDKEWRGMLRPCFLLSFSQDCD